MRWLVHAMIYTKYEVSIFNCSEDMQRSQNFKWVTWPKPCAFGGKFLIHRQRAWHKTICLQNLEHIASSIQKLYRGSHILTLGHVTLTTPIHHPMANTSLTLTIPKILRRSQNLQFIDKICIAHARCHVKSNPIFGFPYPHTLFSMQPLWNCHQQ